MNIHTVFKIFEQENTFGRDIYDGTATLKEVDKEYIKLADKES